MRGMDLIRRYEEARPARMTAAAAALIVAIAFADWKIQPNVSLGFLYLFPILLAAGSLDRRENVALALVCAFLREAFGPFTFSLGEVIPRMTMVASAFIGTSLFISELVRSRAIKRRAGEELRVLIDTSPAAILTPDGEGNVLMANESARHMLGFHEAALEGENVTAYLPFLGSLRLGGRAAPHFRTMVEDRCRRREGELFLAHIWFSTYTAESGPRIAAIVLDASEDFRNWEDAGFRTVMWTSRVLMGAVAHEVRNLCEAGAAAHSALSRDPSLAKHEDVRALGAVLEGLKEIAGARLRLASTPPCQSAEVGELLEEFRLIIEPSVAEAGATLHWDVPPDLPRVRGEHQGLLHVLMNLAQNAIRAMEDSERKELIVSAARENDRVAVRVADTGPGVAEPARLFQPFQPGADAFGLGLYVARAIARSAGGELSYEPRRTGGCFRLELAGVVGDA